MAEEGANALWSLGQAAHVVDDSLLELPLAAGERPGGDGLLEIAVQVLVGVEVRAIGREALWCTDRSGGLGGLGS